MRQLFNFKATFGAKKTEKFGFHLLRFFQTFRVDPATFDHLRDRKIAKEFRAARSTRICGSR
ncbi:hypothetical protein D3C71_1857830 [compost metagenome]